jgi:hypothetical protein
MLIEDKSQYYSKLQVMVDKAKELKTRIDGNPDEESRGYLKMALDIHYSDMRQLIKENDKR